MQTCVCCAIFEDDIQKTLMLFAEERFNNLFQGDKISIFCRGDKISIFFQGDNQKSIEDFIFVSPAPAELAAK